MVRVCKSLIPAQGYPHRDHRSKKGMVENCAYKKTVKIKKREIVDEYTLREMDMEQTELEIQRSQWNDEWQ